MKFYVCHEAAGSGVEASTSGPRCQVHVRQWCAGRNNFSFVKSPAVVCECAPDVQSPCGEDRNLQLVGWDWGDWDL